MERWKTGGIFVCLQLFLFFELGVLCDTETWSEVILLLISKILSPSMSVICEDI